VSEKKVSLQNNSAGKFSRRDFLKMSGFGAAGIAIGANAVGASALGRFAERGLFSLQDQIKLKTAGWPFADPLPTADEIKADPTKQVYADILKVWLDQNPGVTIERIEFNIWDQQTLVTGLAGGTAPTAFHTTVLGSYQMPSTRAAFAQNLAADVTEYYKKLNIDSKIAPYIKAQMGKWEVDGKIYALPTVFNPGVGFIYRKDLIKAAGLEEPTADWTWDDLKKYAKALTSGDRKGVGLPRWGLSWALQAEGVNQNPALGVTTVIPDAASGWNWKWDFSTQADRIVKVIETFREMIFTDKSVFIDQANTDNEIFSAVLDGRIGFAPLHPGFLRRSGEGSPTKVAADLGKKFDEVWGWVQQPRGASGLVGVTVPFLDAISFNPEATKAELEKAVSLYEYFYLGEGYLKQQQALYEQTKDAKRVWGEYPTLTGATTFDKIPVSATDAWGAGVVKSLDTAAAIAYPPEEWQFFPVQKNPAPTLTAFGDFTSRMTFEANVSDIKAELKAVEDSLNAEVKAFNSSVSDADFVAAAKKYYAAQDAYLKANAPKFYDTWKAWYDKAIAPALG
jgi:hypothetical protein